VSRLGSFGSLGSPSGGGFFGNQSPAGDLHHARRLAGFCQPVKCGAADVVIQTELINCRGLPASSRGMNRVHDVHLQISATQANMRNAI
jgi:hypothetical protein